MFQTKYHLESNIYLFYSLIGKRQGTTLLKKWSQKRKFQDVWNKFYENYIVFKSYNSNNNKKTQVSSWIPHLFCGIMFEDQTTLLTRKNFRLKKKHLKNTIVKPGLFIKKPSSTRKFTYS